MVRLLMIGTLVVALAVLNADAFGQLLGEEFKLTATDGFPWDDFGVAVSLSGEYALIGAYRDNNDNGSKDSGAPRRLRRGASPDGTEHALQALGRW